MKKLIPILALAALCGTAAPALAAAPAVAAPAAVLDQDLRVRIWADNDRDYFRSGDRVRVQFRTNRSGYVAVVHLDTDGEVEILYPRSPYDEGYVRGGRTYSLPYGGGSSHWTVRGAPGIGYFFAVFSEEPLDFGAFRDRYGSGWAYRGVGHVRGDPYYALDRIAELLVRNPDYAYYTTDYYGYHVGRRHSYPRYACYDGYADARYWGGYYDSCDRLVILLRDDPYYYDPHRYRRTRGYYLADRYRDEPRHRFKEPGAADRDYVPPLRRGTRSGYDEVSRTRPEPQSGYEERRVLDRWESQQQPQQGRQQGTREREERQRGEERPRLQRRPTEPETSRPRVTAPRREPPQERPRAERPRPEPSRSEPRQERPRPSEGRSPRVRPEGEP